MRLLYLLRHAKSSWDDDSVADIDRPLSKRGRKAAKLMARHFLQHEIKPAAVICSSAKRTRETLKLMAPALDDAPVTLDHRIYEASYQTLLERIVDLPASMPSVLIIGHNPGLERLALFLMADEGHGPGVSRLQEKFPTGSLAILAADIDAWSDLSVGSCRLEDFVRPVDLDGEE